VCVGGGGGGVDGNGPEGGNTLICLCMATWTTPGTAASRLLHGGAEALAHDGDLIIRKGPLSGIWTSALSGSWSRAGGCRGQGLCPRTKLGFGSFNRFVVTYRSGGGGGVSLTEGGGGGVSQPRAAAGDGQGRISQPIRVVC
jgi:hypothetical protein